MLDTEDCSSNHFDIYDGEGTDGFLLGQICSNKITKPFYSLGNSLTIHLVTQYGLFHGDSFSATYSTFTTGYRVSFDVLL